MREAFRSIVVSCLMISWLGSGCASSGDGSQWNQKQLAKERQKVMDDMQDRFDEMQREFEERREEGRHDID